jgi:hypothetical protein
MKKQILSLGLTLKFKYSEKLKNNPPLADIYNKIKDKNIPKTEWHNFIINEIMKSDV